MDEGAAVWTGAEQRCGLRGGLRQVPADLQLFTKKCLLVFAQCPMGVERCFLNDLEYFFHIEDTDLFLIKCCKYFSLFVVCF